MAFHHSPRIVSDGLTFAVDPANSRSHISGSTTATDVISGANGSFTGNTQFLSQNQGVFDFDGTDDYIDFSTHQVLDTSAAFTIAAWGHLDSFSPDVYPGLIRCKTDQATGFITGFSNQSGYEFYAGSSANFVMIYSGIDTSEVLNKWVYATVTYNGSGRTSNGNYKLYLNGVSKTVSNTSGFSATDNSTRIGMGNTTSTQWNGQISAVHVYNRELSANEVLQNYNALKGRFE